MMGVVEEQLSGPAVLAVQIRYEIVIDRVFVAVFWVNGFVLVLLSTTLMVKDRHT